MLYIENEKKIIMNLSWLLDFVEYVLPITGNDSVDTFWFFFIGACSFAAGWFAGGLFKDSDVRSGVHWLVRIGVFLALWVISVLIVRLVLLILSIPWWVWIIIGVVLIHAVVGILLLVKHFKKKRKPKQLQE